MKIFVKPCIIGFVDNKNKMDEEMKMEGNLTKDPILKTLTKLAGSDHGVIVSGDFVQHHGHGLDWSAWFKGSCRCRCWRYVYLAFAGTCSYG